MSVILALEPKIGRSLLEASLGYTVLSRTAWVSEGTLLQNRMLLTWARHLDPQNSCFLCVMHIRPSAWGHSPYASTLGPAIGCIRSVPQWDHPLPGKPKLPSLGYTEHHGLCQRACSWKEARPPEALLEENRGGFQGRLAAMAAIL